MSDTPTRPRLSLREFEVLRAVISVRKTTAAAARLGISQPAVSRAIKHLEERLGKTLFNRESGRLVPTSDALALNEKLEPVFEMLAGIENETFVSQHSSKPLRLAAPPTISHRFLLGVMAAFIKAYPGQKVELEIGTSSDVRNHVAEGHADLGITDGLSKHAGLTLEPLRSAIAHAVLHRDHPLASKVFIEPEDFDGQDFVALTRRFPVRAILERMFAERGIRPNIVAESSTAVSVSELVHAGVGVSVLNPFPVARNHPETLVFLPFKPRISYLNAFILPATTPSTPIARKFIEFTRAFEIEDPYSTPA
jgi:DNA-binding transcriptional LysR family regulator